MSLLNPIQVTSVGEVLKSCIEVMEDDIQHLVGENTELRRYIADSSDRGQELLADYDKITLAIAEWVGEIHKGLQNNTYSQRARPTMVEVHRRLSEIYHSTSNSPKLPGEA